MEKTPCEKKKGGGVRPFVRASSHLNPKRPRGSAKKKKMEKNHKKKKENARGWPGSEAFSV